MTSGIAGTFHMSTHRHLLLASLVLCGVAQASTPTPTSVAAAEGTAAQNPLCNAIEPFYWEIGDVNAAIAGGSVGGSPSDPAPTATTSMNVASATKWLYGSYVVQLRGGAAKLTHDDVMFLTMQSGYTNMGDNGQPAGTCPRTDNPNNVDTCLTQLNVHNGLPFNYQNPADIGVFYYDAGNFENHAGLFTPLGTVLSPNLGGVIAQRLKSPGLIQYSQPLIPGGAYMTADTYTQFLRNILSGSLQMFHTLASHQVCTLPSSTCPAVYSPIPFAWHYSIGHWVEDDPSVNDDGAFSSPGTEGFYPWIEAQKTYYGVIARADTSARQEGVDSVLCGQMIRFAWDTGVVQTGTTRVVRAVSPRPAASPSAR
jgi:hypothetical protein